MHRAVAVLMLLVCAGQPLRAEDEPAQPRIDREDEVAKLPRDTAGVVVHTNDRPRDTRLTALVARCPDLERLTLVAGWHPTAQDWAQLAKLGKLRELNLISSGAPSLATYEQIAKLPALRKLHLTVD